MRLICGILKLDGTVAEQSVLDSMATAMTARGRVPTATRRLEGALGLAALDFTGNSDGLADQDDCIIAADARLYRTASEEHVAIEAALQRHGADFPDHIDGDFAVALWQRDAGTLWLGRDFMGVRPLAWTWQPGRWFAFASLPKGLYGAGLASSAIDPVAVGSKIAHYYFTGSDTGFAEIAYLQAGHSLCVRPRDTTPPSPHRAYRPVPAQVGTWCGTPEQAAATMRRLVQEAVAARLPTSGAVACHLTGGLDSSSITVLAAREARLRDVRVLALSMMTRSALGPSELDERPLINDVLEQETDVAHIVVHDDLPLPGSPQDRDWPGSTIGGFDDQLMAAAAAFGAERVLSGVGGDEGATYNGANIYLRLLKEGHWRHLSTELAARARRDGVSLSKAVRDRLLAPLLPTTLRQLIRRRPRLLDEQQGAARYLGLTILDSVLHRRMPPILQSNCPADRLRALADHHIPSRCTYYAIMAARHGLSVGFPLLDRRVVDFALSLPITMLVAEGQSRQPFRRAMHGILPDRVRLAKYKVGLFDERLIRYAALKPRLLAALAKLRAAPSPRIAEMFDLDAIQVVLEQLPEPDHVNQLVRSRLGSLSGGTPPWLLMLAVQFLNAACNLSSEQNENSPHVASSQRVHEELLVIAKSSINIQPCRDRNSC
jgi:asparagine synthase (glutamine-hydrolysing)